MFKVYKVKEVATNVTRVRFSLPSPEHEMGLSVASCLMARATIDGTIVTRPYTPTSMNEEKGVMELIVKGYPTGQLSKFISQLQVDDTLEMKGPFQKFEYTSNMKKSIGMIAGGSGITPCLQVMKAILNNENDQTKIHLLFANSLEKDIILKDEIDALAVLHPCRFQVTYCISQPSSTWGGCIGHVTKEMVQEYMPTACEENMIYVCGPPGFMEHVSGNKAQDKTQGQVTGLLKELGYSLSMVYKF